MRTRFGPSSARKLWLTTLAVALCLLGSNCGYSTGLSVGEHAHSIGLEVFVNDTPERDFERNLYDEMSRAIRDWTDAPLVAPQKADVVVRGKITAYHRRSGVRTPENQLLETAVYIDVEASVYHAGSETPTRGPVHATTSVGYILPQPQTTNSVASFEAERNARDRALRNIADKLVLDLFAPLN